MDEELTRADKGGSGGVRPLRRGDSGLGRRLSGADASDMPAAPWPDEPAEPVRLEDICVTRTVRGLAFLRGPVCTSLGILVVGLLLLYVVVMVGQAVASATALGGVAGMLLFGIILLLALAVLLACLRLVLVVRRLSGGPALDWQQVSLRAARTGDYEVYATAKEAVLVPYLEAYRKHVARNAEALARLEGWDGERVEGLVAACDRLLLGDEGSSDEWIEAFRAQILEPAIESARGLVMRKARYVGLKTAVSPWPLVDVAAVLYHSVDMVRMLGLVFGRRISRDRALALVVHLSVNLYVAGEAQEALSSIGRGGGEGGASAAGDVAGDEAAGGLEMIFGDLGAQSLKALKALGRKAAEGAANALLIRRLGRRTIDTMTVIAERSG